MPALLFSLGFLIIVTLIFVAANLLFDDLNDVGFRVLGFAILLALVVAGLWNLSQVPW